MMAFLDRWFTKGRKLHVPWEEQPLRFRFYVNMLEYGRRARYLIGVYNMELIGVVIAIAALVVFG